MKSKSTKKIVETKRKQGRPTDYSKKLDTVAKRLAAKGLTNDEIYKTMGISKDTGINWRRKYESFAEAIRLGRIELKNTLVEKSLFQLATGFERSVQKAFVVSDGKDMGAHIEKVHVKDYFPPQVSAIKYLLNNRKPLAKDPENGWAEKQTIEHTGTLNYKVLKDEDEETE